MREQKFLKSAYCKRTCKTPSWQIYYTIRGSSRPVVFSTFGHHFTTPRINGRIDFHKCDFKVRDLSSRPIRPSPSTIMNQIFGQVLNTWHKSFCDSFMKALGPGHGPGHGSDTLITSGPGTDF
jgi:hypothetical protein